LTARKIILDCDPGIDDALAIVFAHGHPGLELCGITTVAGNVGLDLTTANALRVRELLGLASARVPVVAGSAGPLLAGPLRAMLDARHAHGDDGLAGALLPPPATKPRDGHAVDFLIDTITAAPGEITLVATGPLTNIALAVRREPALVTRVRDFVIMGGSATRGNVTPAAEFNIAADPEAAAVVFSAGWRVTMAGLDVTLRARVRPPVLERMRGLGRLADDLLLPCLARYRLDPPLVPGPDREAGPGGPAVHDVCALVQVARPDLIGCASARVDVETCGRLTTGMTVTDFRAAPENRNALVATGIDEDGFWDVVIDAFTRAAAPVAQPTGM
jgi:purine nucleosidase